MTIESPLARYSYMHGALVQACDDCDWAQAGHRKELAHCPECGAALPERIAIQFGGISVIYTGKNFDVTANCGGFVSIEEADYADVIAFMCRHGTDYRPESSWGIPRVRRVEKARDFDETCKDAWRRL